jgi:ATP-dependent Clp protease ATP-binding subunit ClpA
MKKYPQKNLFFYALFLFSFLFAQAQDRRVLTDAKKQLKSTTANSYGIPISSFQNLEELSEFLNGFEKIIPASLKTDAEFEEIYAGALMIAIKGRGNTAKEKPFNGWSLGRNESEVEAFVQNILNKKILTQEKLDQLILTLNKINYSSEDFKKSIGFPPQFDIGDPQKMISRIKQAIPSHFVYTRHVPKVMLLKDKIEALGLDPVTQNYFEELLGSLENNHYDRAVEDIANNTVPNYFGRSWEMTQIRNGLNRVEKGHILLTGKAGVGKSTILEMLQVDALNHPNLYKEMKAPIVLELPVTSVTNPSDPSEIKSLIRGMQSLAQELDERIVLFIDEAHIATDMTKNALKGFLTQKLNEYNRITFIWATTSVESSVFNSDAAFLRRWSEVNVKEFSDEEAIQSIKLSKIDLWKKAHSRPGYTFTGEISPEAYDLALRYKNFEQTAGANPTALKELLEGAVTAKMGRLMEGATKGSFSLEEDDVTHYLEDKLHLDLIPGASNFNEQFEEKWKVFCGDYIGNEGLKHQLKIDLKSYFINPNPEMMLAIFNFGPPGAGKTYLSKTVAKHFFKNSYLEINGKEFAHGDLDQNKLGGTVPGTIGYNEKSPGILPKFFKNNPHGGIILVDEADYVHSDFMDLLANMISSKKFRDGTGHEYDTSKYIFMLNTNIGQKLLISPDLKSRMSWAEIKTNEKAISHVLEDGSLQVKSEIKNDLLADFMRKVFVNAHPDGETSQIAQDTSKLFRRFKTYYTLLPSKEDMIATAQLKIKKMQEEWRVDKKITFEISDEAVLKILDLENINFSQGYTNVDNKLDALLKNHLANYISKKDHIQITVEGQNLVFFSKLDAQAISYKIPEESLFAVNPWRANETINTNINNLMKNMAQDIVGRNEAIEKIVKQIKDKRLDFSKRLVFAFLGTTGNGKTELGKSLATNLFGGDKPFFTIENITHPYSWNDYFRPPSGIIASNEETEFERWIERRKNVGGVIIIDEFFSFKGLTQDAIGNKIAAFNEIYRLLDEGIIKIRGKDIDLSNFIIHFTGNAMQEAFEHAIGSPESENLVASIEQELNNPALLKKYLSDLGFDAPKMARIGLWDIKGPLNNVNFVDLARKYAVTSRLKDLQKLGIKIDFIVDDQIIQKIIDLSKHQGEGFRDVKKMINHLIHEPLTQIIDEKMPQKVEIKLNGKELQWFINDRENILIGEEIARNLIEKHWKEVNQSTINYAPSFQDYDHLEPKLKTGAQLKVITDHEVGHWMVATLLHNGNIAKSININSFQNMGGYVRFDTEKLYADKLTEITKNILILKAGQASNFQEGIYATGTVGKGGDLERMNQLYNQLTNENILSFSELTLYKKMIEEMTDFLLQKGKDLKLDEGIKALLVEHNGIISEEILNKYVQGFSLKENFFEDALKKSKETHQGNKDAAGIFEKIEKELKVIEVCNKAFIK